MVSLRLAKINIVTAVSYFVRLTCLLAALVCVQKAALAAAPRPEIWFAPMDWFVRPVVNYGGSTDYMALFHSPEANSLLSRISVFKIYSQFANWGSDDDLKRIFAELKRRHIALAMEAGMLTANEQCGRGVEGYGGQDAVKRAEKIRRLGGELAYIAMDELLGAAYKCHLDYAETARNAARNVAAVKEVFPRIGIGAIETQGTTPQAAQKWAEAFRAATGQPFAFFHIDIGWKLNWHGPVENLAAAIHRLNIPLGIICNGTDDAPTDEAWIAGAQEHCRAIESDPKIRPDQLVFQSWVRHPTHIFPASDPGTFSHLLEDYFRTHPR